MHVHVVTVSGAKAFDWGEGKTLWSSQEPSVGGWSHGVCRLAAKAVGPWPGSRVVSESILGGGKSVIPVTEALSLKMAQFLWEN